MKNKHGKGEQPLHSENEVLDGRDEHPASNKGLWLGRTFGLDEDIRVSQARSMSSELFLQTRLFPLIERRLQVDERMLVDLLVEFKRSRKDLDVGFEIANVMARILSRFQWYLIDEEEGALPSDALERELDLFTILASLDFKSIDEEVQTRLHSG